MTVATSTRDIAGRNAKAAQEAADYASKESVDLRVIEMDVSEQASVDAAVQRLNRAALRHLRNRRDGLVVWVSSTSTRGGTPPYGPVLCCEGSRGLTCGDLRR